MQLFVVCMEGDVKWNVHLLAWKDPLSEKLWLASDPVTQKRETITLTALCVSHCVA